MAMWDYEVNNNVRSGVTADNIRHLISNGTLKPSSHIQETGSDRWVAVQQSEFASLLPGTPTAQLAGLASAGRPTGERALRYCSIGFAVLVVIGVLISLMGRHATSLFEAIVENTAVLRDIDVLLVCVVVAIFVSARAVMGQLRVHADFVRVSETLKVQELHAIRRVLDQQSPRP